MRVKSWMTKQDYERCRAQGYFWQKDVLMIAFAQFEQKGFRPFLEALKQEAFSFFGEMGKVWIQLSVEQEEVVRSIQMRLKKMGFRPQSRSFGRIVSTLLLMSFRRENEVDIVS